MSECSLGNMFVVANQHCFSCLATTMKLCNLQVEKSFRLPGNDCIRKVIPYKGNLVILAGPATIYVSGSWAV